MSMPLDQQQEGTQIGTLLAAARIPLLDLSVREGWSLMKKDRAGRQSNSRSHAEVVLSCRDESLFASNKPSRLGESPVWS